MKSGGSFGFILFLLLVVGAALILAPFFAPALPSLSRGILIASGCCCCCSPSSSGSTASFTAGPRPTRLSCGPAARRKCIIDAGAVVIPVIHEVIPVSLKTFKLEVDRTGPEALIRRTFCGPTSKRCSTCG